MLVAREKETAILEDALHSDESCFIAVYGRRRVGKTYLIRETYGKILTFEHAGLADGTKKEQLYAFTASLKRAGLKVKDEPSGWLQAFELLKDHIDQSKKKRKVIFLDELSWMDTHKSGFLTALEHFWNGWASARKDIILVVCASATSWMINKIIHNKGGLYNRLTARIPLEQFTLSECEAYLQSKSIVMSRYEILELYMAIGGVPFYWNYVKKGRSAVQNIDEMFFAENAPMKDEFQYLYASLFKNPENYIAIVTALAKKKKGMKRNELAGASGIPNSGYLTKIADELISCGFIRKYTMFGKKNKDFNYQLMDNYTLFYFQFLEKQQTDEHFWSNQLGTSKRNAWCGFAFEHVCLQHIPEIKGRLGITGVLTEVHSFSCDAYPAEGIRGAQIDLLIVRKDRIINVCEMKYSDGEYTFTKKDDASMRNSMMMLKKVTNTRYALHPTLITTYGLTDSMYSGIIQSAICADDLFQTNILR